MPATGQAVRIVSGPRYRLVATFAGGGEETARDEFDSIPAAQAGVGAFVCDVAERGRPMSIRVERIMHPDAGGNGQSAHGAHSTPGETLRRWDESVIDRILRQQTGWAGAAGRATSGRTEPAATARSESHVRIGAVEMRVGTAPETPEVEAAEPSDLEADAAAIHESVERELPAPEAAAPKPESIAVRRHDERPTGDAEVAHLSAEPGELASPVAPEHRHAAYRPHHRRTRWVLILTAAFIAILFGGMILLETNGDPISYLRKLSSGEKVRETLPFRNGNGDGAATKPAGRK